MGLLSLPLSLSTVSHTHLHAEARDGESAFNSSRRRISLSLSLGKTHRRCFPSLSLSLRHTIHRRRYSLSVSLSDDAPTYTMEELEEELQKEQEKEFEEYFPGSHSIRTKRQLMKYLKENRVITSLEVARVMNIIDRALFVPDCSPPYVDCRLLNGFHSFMLAPRHHAQCLELLQNHLKPGMHALDIGSGTGYLTACFAVMVGCRGRAVGVDLVPELVELSIKNIEKSKAAPLLKQGSLSVHVGNGVEGWAECAPYDAISVGFLAPELFPAFIEQLKPGGRLLVGVEDGDSVKNMVIDNY
ncbi:hypothetical protein ACP275_09G012100 [Erythranthe tilingii]